MKPYDLCTLDEVRDWLGLKPENVAHDAKLERLISSVSSKIIRKTGREFVSRDAVFTDPGNPAYGAITVPTTTRTFRLGLYASPELYVGDLAELTSATVNGNAASIATWQTLPDDGPPWSRLWLDAARSLAFPAGSVVAVTGKWGFPEIPDEIRQAAIDQVKAWFDRSIRQRGETAQDAEGATVPRDLDLATWETIQGWRRIGPILA